MNKNKIISVNLLIAILSILTSTFTSTTSASSLPIGSGECIPNERWTCDEVQ